MRIFPAIDLWEGRAVCLPREKDESMTVCSAQACGVARRFLRGGARDLHIMDLQGAREGQPGFANFIEIEALLRQGHAFIQVGGGICTEEHILQYLELGAAQVILHANDVTPAFAGRMARRYGAKIAVGLDVRDGVIAAPDGDGIAFCRQLRDAGVETVVCAAVDRNEPLTPAMLETCRQLAEIRGLEAIVAVSIGSAEEIRVLKEIGIAGVIPGRNLYDGGLDLGMCLDAAASGAEPEDDEMPLF